MATPDITWPALLTRLFARHDLTHDEATWAMDQVIRGDATPARLAAFLAALRTKGETPAELDGFVTALLRAAPTVHIPGPTVDIAGTGGDGTNAVNISTMAAIVLAATGTTVVKHGGRAASATSAGSADLVEQLGIPLDLPPADLAAVAVEAGITFLPAAALHPGMRHAGPIRRELATPTAFNALGPLINPAHPTHRLIGVADARLLPTVVELLRTRGANALVVRGDDGLDKLSTATTSQMWRVHAGRTSHHVLDPRELGLARPATESLRGGDATRNARVTHALLTGEPGPVRDVVLLNAAAAAVTAAEAEPSPERLAEALHRGAEAIDSGAAAAVLQRWRHAARTRQVSRPGRR